MSHCQGSNCSKKYLCQKYFNDGDVVDFSTYGSGKAGTDENGKPFCEVTVWCGDNGTNGYKYFEPKDKGFSTLSYKNEYTDKGPKFKLTFEIELPYESYIVLEYPTSCSSCPVGFMNSGECGRNAPFTDEDYKQRPSTCKLKRITPEEIQQMIISKYNMIETIPPVEK